MVATPAPQREGEGQQRRWLSLVPVQPEEGRHDREDRDGGQQRAPSPRPRTPVTPVIAAMLSRAQPLVSSATAAQTSAARRRGRDAVGSTPSARQTRRPRRPVRLELAHGRRLAPERSRPTGNAVGRA